MKKKEIVEGVITRVDFPNKGILETEEGTVMVKNALPGQQVSCRIQKIRKNKAEARLLEVLKEPDTSIPSPCPHFGSCGGCTYLTMTYEEELKLKEEQVLRLLSEPLSHKERNLVFSQDGAELDCHWDGILGSPRQFGFRNKMEFTFGDETMGGPLSLGMHKRGSMHDIVSVRSCQIVDEDYRKIISCVTDYFGELYDRKEITFYHRVKLEGYLRHLIVRKAVKTEEILIDLVTTTQEEHDLSGFVNALLSLSLNGRITGILHTVNDSPADAVINEGTKLLYGRDFFEEELLGLRFQITPFSFFQTNSLSAEVLYNKVQDYVLRAAGKEKGQGEKCHILYDLYCGTGTISQLMSPVADKVIGVEIVEEAVVAAKENAKRNGVNNCEFIAADVLKALDEISEKPDFIILDPPRDGVHPKALSKILNYGVEHIVYVSCKPTSLARDMEAFQEAGYYAERGCCVDQFPWSANVETICIFTKNP